MSFFKDKRTYWISFLGLVCLAQIALFFALDFYTLPQYKKQLGKLTKQVEDLQEEKKRLYDNAGVTQVLSDYNAKAEFVKVFQTARNDVFHNGEEGKFDFVPDLLGTIFPVITAHLHNSITVEGISINEKAEVVIPVHSDSYTTLAKQFLAFKEAFDQEPVPLLTDIKVNTFTRQEMEILERDENRNFVKQRKKVSKATIIARINPEFFQDSQNEDILDTGLELSDERALIPPQAKKLNILQRTKNIIQNILQNIQKDINMLMGKKANLKTSKNIIPTATAKISSPEKPIAAPQQEAADDSTNKTSTLEATISPATTQKTNPESTISESTEPSLDKNQTSTATTPAQ